MTNIYIDALDRSDGNGSRSREEDWLDANTTASENQWSTAETTFYMSEVPKHKKKRFKSLYDRHHGKGESDRSSTLARMKMMADTESFCAMLELSQPLRERVVHIMQDIDISANNFGGKSYEKIILAVISLVHDEHLSAQPKGAIDFDQRLIFDDDFRELMDSNSIGSREMRGVRDQIRQKTEYF